MRVFVQIAGSSSGRTPLFGSGYEGPNPSPAAIAELLKICYSGTILKLWQGGSRMQRYLLFTIASLLLVSGSAFAQNLSGETEVGTDGKGEGFFSHYLFFDTKNVNVLARYFYVNGVLQRGEFAIGPTLKLGNSNVLKLQFGGYTDKSVMLAGLLIAKVRGREVLYIANGKLSTRGGLNTLYQKLFIPLTKSGRWQFRAEDLQVGSEQGFMRLGLEYQHKLPDNAHIFIAPYYDPIRKAVGGQFGLRFF